MGNVLPFTKHQADFTTNHGIFHLTGFFALKCQTLRLQWGYNKIGIRTNVVCPLILCNPFVDQAIIVSLLANIWELNKIKIKVKVLIKKNLNKI